MAAGEGDDKGKKATLAERMAAGLAVPSGTGFSIPALNETAKRPTTRHTVMLYADVAQRLKIMAAERQSDVSALIREALDAWLAGRG